MKLELGGGKTPKGDGFVNADIGPGADVVCDFDEYPWPFEDDSVTELYSAHCLEHLQDPNRALIEIGRICRLGAEVTLRMPDPQSDVSYVPGHTCALSEEWLRNVTEHFVDAFWGDSPKVTRLIHVTRRADPLWFPRARQSPLFTGWSDEEIMTWIPRTCHECEYHLEVVDRDDQTHS